MNTAKEKLADTGHWSILSECFWPPLFQKKWNFKKNKYIFWEPDYLTYLHFKYKTVSLKISHITNPFLNSTSFAVQ